MRITTQIASLFAIAGLLATQACGDVPVDTAGGLPVAGVIRGTVRYDGPLPCSRNGHFVGNAIVLLFDARNPPAPGGLGMTAVNFGVVPGDVLFHDATVTPGPTKVCPAPDAPSWHVTAPFTISPVDAGAYLVQAFFDTTGNFFATLEPRNLPEATDVGGGYIDVDEATTLVQDPFVSPAVSVKPAAQYPNYQPRFLRVDVGTPGPVPATSLHGVPELTMPEDGFVADGVSVTIGAKLTLARPYFYPEGVVLPAGQSNPNVTLGPPSAERPSAGGASAANPTANPDFVPVLSFPQDLMAYAQPSAVAIAVGGANVVDAYQAGFPQLTLHAGVPVDEQAIAADATRVDHPFHMQLGLPDPPPGAAPGGNGGIFVWWNACDGLPGCVPHQSDFIPESDQIYRMWPLVVLTKLRDLATLDAQPNPADPQSVASQGSDLAQPVVVLQGITLFQDSLAATSTASAALTGGKVGRPPTAPTTPVDHVSVVLRPSTLCVDPRTPDTGGVLVTPGAAVDPVTQAVLGPYPPGDTVDHGTGVVVDSHVSSNPQLAQAVNRKAAGTTNGLLAGCLPTGRYAVNVVYPTGQAWTTPNEAGSCAAGEGDTRFDGVGSGAGLVGTCAVKPRPVLYSQGTRAVVEITPTTSATNCRSPAPADGSIPAVPFACTSLCPSPRLDPTASPPCAVCLDPSLDPASSPPCTAPKGGAQPRSGKERFE